MFVAIVGTRSAGKSTIENYLVSNLGFSPVRLGRTDLVQPNFIIPALHESAVRLLEFAVSLPQDTFQASSSPGTNFTASSGFAHHSHPLTFASPEDLLIHATRNWRKNFVTVDLTSSPLIGLFAKRPFFLLVNVDAPLLQRYRRSQGPGHISLEEFVRQDDECVFGTNEDANSPNQTPSLGLRAINHLVKLNVTNSFQSLSELYRHLDSLDMMNSERLRPKWDTYFMTLAELASHRSNCMKRRVGAILVRDNRVVATGYNGTPRGVMNCNDGGCAPCNLASNAYDVECLCLHAEENALLEAGRDRVGTNAILYCNTCPCLRCTIKIIQCGVKMVVYNLSYKVCLFRDEASAKLFQEAGVEIRRHVPPHAP